VKKVKVKTKKTAHRTSSSRTRCRVSKSTWTPNKKAPQTRLPKKRIMAQVLATRSSHWWPRCQLKADKDRGRLNLWRKYPLTMNQSQPLRPKTRNPCRNKTRLLSKIRSKGRSKTSLRRHQLRQQQRRKTLNKNKLNKIIKLRIEFKFEKTSREGPGELCVDLHEGAHCMVFAKESTALPNKQASLHFCLLL
jgi:hypothetical protein